ncbi:sirohydrochlorin chelatase [Niallia sp. FSL W8-0635]|uniref:sirohydrochlorin chelatase n=1 Tax=Niallia sp. FSL W8-0635 TaxID=2975337 RepID=UPI0009CE6DAF|nr:Ferrochelatase Che1 [Mycobacteroides abscessus subsp. abscessus]HEO8420128.1 sirohydrochlorin chelatase [Yersinia enterocolitica]
MEAVLYICHGSRVQEASAQAISFVKKCMETNGFQGIQEYSFLELSEPSIEEGFRNCVEKGATIIHIIPVLLLTAAHAKKDIPEVLEKLSLEYPQVQIKYGKPIGVHPQMVKIVADKIKSTSLYKNTNEEVLVILVGRGSSDPDVKRDLCKIASLIEKQVDRIVVQDCYLTAAQPSFEEALQMAEQSSNRHVLVIPYLLFTGILMKSMEKTINKIKSINKEYVLAPYLGYDPLIAEILKERIDEMMVGNEYALITG